jgi:hypothetical protein
VVLDQLSDVVWHLKDLVARDEPISEQLREEAGKLNDIVLTEVRLPEGLDLVTMLILHRTS